MQKQEELAAEEGDVVLVVFFSQRLALCLKSFLYANTLAQLSFYQSEK
jgi:hypothetical protein